MSTNEHYAIFILCHLVGGMSLQLISLWGLKGFDCSIKARSDMMLHLSYKGNTVALYWSLYVRLRDWLKYINWYMAIFWQWWMCQNMWCWCIFISLTKTRTIILNLSEKLKIGHPPAKPNLEKSFFLLDKSSYSCLCYIWMSRHASSHLVSVLLPWFAFKQHNSRFTDIKETEIEGQQGKGGETEGEVETAQVEKKWAVREK